MNTLTSAPLGHINQAVNGRIEIYLINLDRCEDRLQTMAMELGAIGLRFQRIAAVDGHSITLPIAEFDEHAYRICHGRLPNRFEIGCYLSHVACARRLIESDASHALILEDDLELDADLPALLSAALDQQDEWDLLRLSTVSRGRKIPLRTLTHRHALAITLTREKGSGAYVINRKAAGWIAHDLVPMRLPYDLAFDMEHFGRLRALFIHPAPVRQNTAPQSFIQNGMRRLRLPKGVYVTVLPIRAYFELTRFVARSIRLATELAGDRIARRRTTMK
jgi:glycosyl transferase, family 25